MGGYDNFPDTGLVIPYRHQPDEQKDYSDYSLLLPKPGKDYLTMETPKGSFPIKGSSDFLKLFLAKWNFTFSPLNELDRIFSHFSKDQMMDLDQQGWMEFGDYLIFHYIGTAKIRLQKGGNTRSEKYIVDLSKFTEKGTLIHSLDQLQELVDKFISLNSVLPLNPMSPASSTKDLLLRSSSEEFSLFNNLSGRVIRFLHTGYIGPRMETKYIGTLENMDNIDLRKAYLRALGRCPSIRKEGILRTVRTKRFYPEAHPGSVYDIQVTVPDSYKEFPPIPVKMGHTCYPHGAFPTRVTKPYIDTIIKCGDIPFKILDSIQILLEKNPLYPFKELASKIELFEDTIGDQFKPINPKNLHYTLQGHMLHFHEIIEENSNGKTRIYYKASADYNPIDACAIQSMVANMVWWDSRGKDVIAISVDALRGHNLKAKKGYKQDKSGLMTFLTPALKDKPGSTVYRDLIEKNKDQNCIHIWSPHRTSIREALRRPWLMGRERPITMDLYPSAGNRLVNRPWRIGDLLDGPIPCQIPTAGEMPNGEVSYSTEWLDKYLTYFHETQK